MLLCFPALAAAHGGGLDEYGCHHDRKRGGYHCHRGEHAGMSFASQAHMLREQADKTTRQSGSDTKKPAAGKRKPKR